MPASASYQDIIQIYQPYVKNNTILLCPSNQAYAYNEELCGPTGVVMRTPGTCKTKTRMGCWSKASSNTRRKAS